MPLIAPRHLLRLLRPHQWLKSGFVLTGIVFAHQWHDVARWQQVGVLIVAFSLLSSAVYILNDLQDREADRHHPHKQHRPLAAGLVTTGLAWGLHGVLLVASLALGYLVSINALLCLLAYLGLNVLYSTGGKRIVVLDVFMLAAGFVLRILVGTAGIGIPTSHWLILCGVMLSLFLGFCKRRSEFMALNEDRQAHRAVLQAYTLPLLDSLVMITAAGSIMGYSLYTMSPETIRIHQTTGLIYTVPIVMYGLFRYLFLVHKGEHGTDMAKDLLQDRHLLVTIGLWLAVTLWLISPAPQPVPETPVPLSSPTLILESTQDSLSCLPSPLEYGGSINA
jgi:4-hydroxybenzoate polyprenyltransferase